MPVLAACSENESHQHPVEDCHQGLMESEETTVPLEGKSGQKGHEQQEEKNLKSSKIVSHEFTVS